MLSGFALFIIFVILLWSFIYTVSYALWTWKDKNRLGAVMIILLAVSIIVLPVYTIFFRNS